MNITSGMSLVTAKWIQEYGGKAVKGKVLDLGCGSKPWKRLLADRPDTPVTEWVGLDSRPVGEVEADAHEIPLADGSFDTVLAIHLLQYCISPLQVVQEAARVLKPGGSFVAVTYNTFQDDRSSLFNIKTKGLNDLCVVAGLKPVSLQAAGNLFENEAENFRSRDKHSFYLPGEFPGWITYLDDAYPNLSCIVAQKE